MFPSEPYKELCIKNQGALEWEPQIGDFFTYYDNKYKTIRFDCLYSGDMADGWTPLADHTWLPRLDQLIEMLEKRGRFLMFKGPCAMEEYRYHVTAMAEDLTRLDARIDSYGPDPTTALLKAYLKVEK